MDQEYFTIPEAAEKMRVTTAAIRKWIAQGKIDVVYVGSDRRITGAAIEAFIKASTEARKTKRDAGSAKMDAEIPALGHAASSLVTA